MSSNTTFDNNSSKKTSTIQHENDGHQNFIFYNSVKRFICDIREGFLSYPVWLTLGWKDIKQRYRRSILGPFWITLSLAFTVVTMGLLYGKLFHQEIRSYLPYLTSGLVIWGLVSTMINECTTVLTSAEGIIRQISLPLSVHILRMITRNLIIFAHNIAVFVVVAFIFRVKLGWSLLLFPVGILILALNILYLAFLLGTLCARFRDVGQIVITIVQILFFITPVMWRPEALGEHAWLSRLNPLTQYFDLLRDPLLGHSVSLFSWIYVGIMSILGWLITILIFPKYRSKVAYWV